uniref:SLC26A/SulP transporter domain-containing protein n=1 Tax=Timema douglasi TaxID=61478 RepID=A0A7R8VSJ8_TIMDO|nr:unnamed protein product [Timema douglasi]
MAKALVVLSSTSEDEEIEVRVSVGGNAPAMTLSEYGKTTPHDRRVYCVDKCRNERDTKKPRGSDAIRLSTVSCVNKMAAAAAEKPQLDLNSVFAGPDETGRFDKDDGGREGERRSVASQPINVSFHANKNRWITETVDGASYWTGLAGKSYVEKCHDLADGALSSWRAFKSELRSRLRDGSTCSRADLEKRLPVVRWLPRYSKQDLVHDALAGITVGLTTVPQALAYAGVAGLRTQYGLYSSLVGPFIYIFLGGSKDITIGPTAILALMTRTFVSNHGEDFAVLLTFLSGCVISLLGLLRMGFLVDFISLPVTVGFTSAAAVTIASTQVKDLLGYGGENDDFLQAWKNLEKNASHSRLTDSLLGVMSIVALLLARGVSIVALLVARICNFKVLIYLSLLGVMSIVALLVARELKNLDLGKDSREIGMVKRVVGKCLWLVSIARNALIVVIGAVIAYICQVNGSHPFRLTGEVTEGFPPLQPPPFSSTDNGTEYSFAKMTGVLGAGVVIVPLISILESVAIAKSFAKGKPLDATQEMIALGLSNILGSFIRSMPVTGSFTRTAVNNASGVRTQLGGFFTGLLLLLTLGFMTKFISYIPKASLAALIISAMFFMVEYEMVPKLWKTRKLDLIPFIATFFGCLFISLDYGIVVGILVNVSFILYKSARPNTHIKRLKINGREMLVARPDQGLVFPAAEFFRQVIHSNACFDEGDRVTLVLDGTHIAAVDFTMVTNLKSLIEDLELRKQSFIFWNWRRSAERTCRALDPAMGRYFRYGSALNDLFQDKIEEDSSSREYSNASTIVISTELSSQSEPQDCK